MILVNRIDLSGFDRRCWPSRDLLDHQVPAENHLNAKLSKNPEKKNYGVRYSVLLELPYWDPIKFAVVDPMHNLFLGTGKHMMHI